MHERAVKQLGISVYEEQLDNGLQVYLLPKPGFQQVYAMFTTRYGSVDSVFRKAGDEAFTEVPDGIAHFLEHKMFESEAEPVFTQFARHGGAANAFTASDQTSYLFSCTQDVADNTRILLDFVQNPHFTPENVEKEKGIIGQEIRMYDDDPNWRGYFGLLQALYHRHPVRLDTAGTVDSIARIDDASLYLCYQTFYHPSNMIFVAVGGFDPETMLDLIRTNQSTKQFSPVPTIERQVPEEPTHVAKPYVEAHLSVSQPRCLIGWKDRDTGLSADAMLRREMLTGLVLDAMFGRGGDLYQSLIDDGIIDQQFNWEYEVTETYGYSQVGGNTADPRVLQTRINAALQQAATDGLEQSLFERSRRKAMGRFLASLDVPSYIARSYTAYRMKDIDLFDALDVLQSFDLAEANARLRDHFVTEQQAVSVVLPKD